MTRLKSWIDNLAGWLDTGAAATNKVLEYANVLAHALRVAAIALRRFSSTV